MPRPQFQCVPNLSEARRPQVVTRLAGSVRGIAGVRLADFSSDLDHNRMVLTMIGNGPGLEQAILALFETALEELDISEHEGAHPRLGAVDVVPFVPLGDTPMEAAVDLSQRVGAQVGERFRLPVFLYERAARLPERRHLPDLRRGGLAGLSRRLGSPGWTPDYGPSQLHPRLGATVIGARLPLLAFNVVLDTSDMEVARAIATRIRERDGGLRSLRALAVWLESQGRVQISMNLTDPGRTGLYQALEQVRTESRRYGVAIRSSQVIGLCATSFLLDAAAYYMQLDGFDATRTVEHHILEYLSHATGDT